MGQLDAAHRAMVQRPCTIHHHDLDLAAACVHAHGLVGVGAGMADDKEQALSNTIISATSFSDLSISHACGDGPASAQFPGSSARPRFSAMSPGPHPQRAPS